MNLHLDELRREASSLSRMYCDGNSNAIARVHRHCPGIDTIRFSDALNVIAQEKGFDTWARFRSTVEYKALDLAAKRNRLKIALFYGQHWMVDRLLQADPKIPNGNLGLELAMYDKFAVQRALDEDSEAASRRIGIRTPILHLAFSRHIHAAPEKESDMLAIADMLLDNGTDVNDGFPAEPGSSQTLSALYGAVGHADNIRLAQWLLENGADPNDGESLFHSTENGHPQGTKLLLQYGAVVEGTNALLRTIDFNNHESVLLLLKNCCDPNATETEHPSGQPTLAVPIMHQVARRLCDGRMAKILLEGGADPNALYCGRSTYAYARMYGNDEVAQELVEHEVSQELSEVESLLASVADNACSAGVHVQHQDLPTDIRMILPNILRYPSRLGHCKRLVELGFDFEKADELDVSPVQIAGWEGLPDAMEWLLSLGPDLNHINGFGGNLLSTIIHGSENCPERHRRDHVRCAALALDADVPLPIQAIEYAGDEKMSEFLLMWSEDHPGQLTQDGIG